MTDWRQEFKAAFSNLDCKLDWPLKQQTYFKLGGLAELFVQISDLTDLQEVRRYVTQHDLKLTLIGGGSNVVVADEGVSGLVVKLTNQELTVADGVVRVGSGQKTALLVRKTLDASLTGLEYFLGVPGSVGGAVFNNAHYQNHLISEYIIRVQIVTLAGEVIWLSS
jgi:UDP-N-acetylmuramate dehydrogenase